MINYDTNWSSYSFPVIKTEQGFINLRKWARKKALEMFAGTEIGRRMAKLTTRKRNKKLLS